MTSLLLSRKPDLNKAIPVVEEVVRELGASGLSYDADVAKVSK